LLIHRQGGERGQDALLIRHVDRSARAVLPARAIGAQRRDRGARFAGPPACLRDREVARETQQPRQECLPLGDLPDVLQCAASGLLRQQFALPAMAGEREARAPERQLECAEQFEQRR